MNNLINTCLQRGSRDNMTAMVVIFSHTAPPVAATSAPLTAQLRAVTPGNGHGSGHGAQHGLPHVQGGSPRMIAFATPDTRGKRAALAEGSSDVYVLRLKISARESLDGAHH